MTAGSEVFYQRTRFSSCVNLNTVDAAVAHVGDREVNNAVSSHEGESADRTIVLHAIYLNMSSG